MKGYLLKVFALVCTEVNGEVLPQTIGKHWLGHLVLCLVYTVCLLT